MTNTPYKHRKMKQSRNKLRFHTYDLPYKPSTKHSDQTVRNGKIISQII